MDILEEAFNKLLEGTISSNDLIKLIEDNLSERWEPKNHDNELKELMNIPKEELTQTQRVLKRKYLTDKVRRLLRGLRNEEAMNKAGEEHQKAIEANLKECIVIIKEAFDALFEVSGTEEDEKKQNVNKIKREKKVGPGKEPTEIVSVADELFPYEGSAKEQFNQKVIAKINDMIEGKATLEDLIQLVRQKKTPVREGLEGVAKVISLMETLLDENKLDDQKSAALTALKELRKTYNSGRRHYEAQSKKLPGKIKKAEKDFDNASKNVESAKWEVQKNFTSPEKEGAKEVFSRVATGNYKDDNEKQTLINIHKELSKKYHDQLDPKMEEATKKATEDREQKRKVMADLRSPKTKDNIEQQRANYWKKVGDLDTSIEQIKND